jgi:hypothetical protein
MRRVIAILALLYLVQITPIPNAYACDRGEFGGQVSTCGTTMSWRDDRAAGTISTGGRSEYAEDRGVRYRYRYENDTACQGEVLLHARS